MFKVSRFLHLFLVLALAIPAGVATAREKAQGKYFDFAKTRAFMCEMETRPDFPVAMVLANDYVYSLLALGGKIEPARKKAIVGYLKNAQQKNGGFVADKADKTASLLYTDIALETLGYLNRTDAIDAAKVRGFVASLRNPDGGFGFSQLSKSSSLATTYYALRVLKATGGLDLVDKVKTAEYVKRFEKKDGGFGSVQGTGVANARNSYMAAYVLNTLGMLKEGTRKNAVKFLGTTPYLDKKSKQRPELDEQLYAVLALKELKSSESIDRKRALAFMKRLYIKVNGGFGPLEGYGSTPDSTGTALRVLVEIGALKGFVPAKR